ncbi:DUF1080 domain-containing protein [Prolixibacteraceae bacterium]|nr:DUF1080 domain-containing protein [Prolixibacteraceae bacterium]
MKQVVLYLIIAILSPIVLKAQGDKILDRQVKEILVQMPCENLVELNKLMEKAISYGAPFIIKLTEKTTPLGECNNISVRYTINSLARYTSSLEDESIKLLLEEGLLKAIQKEDNREVKTFFINQLNLIGSNRSVEELGAMLIDPQFCEPVTQLFLSIQTDKAKEILVDNLSNVDGKRLVTIVKALGNLKVEEANGKILALPGQQSKELQKVVHASLASIGAPESYDYLLNACMKIGFKYESSNTVGSFIAYTDELGQNGYLKRCKKSCESLLRYNNELELLHNRAATIHIYAKYYPNKATKLLLKEVESMDKVFRSSILDVAKNLVDDRSVKRWVAKGKASPEAVEEDIILMLGEAKQNAAVPYLNECLGASSKDIRVAAIRSLASLEGKDAVPSIVQHIIEGKDIDQSKSCLLYLVGRDNLELISQALPKTSGKSKAALIDVIAEKAGSLYFDQVFAHTKDNNKEVKKAAIDALKSISRAEDLRALLDLLESVDNAYITTVQQAVYHSILEHQDRDSSVDRLIASLDSSKDKVRFISILPKIGGVKALDKVTEIYNGSEGRLKEVALDALCEWNSSAASQILYSICKQSSTFQQKAFNGFVSQIVHSNLPNDQKLLELKKIMVLATDNEQKLKVISSLARVKTYQSMIFASTFLEKQLLQQAACHSIMAIALPSGGKSNGFIGSDTYQILAKVKEYISGEDSDYLKINIQRYMDKMPKDKGFISLFNGKDLTYWKGFVAPPIKMDKMNANLLSKKQKEADINMHKNWSVKDGTIVFSGKGDNLCSAKEYTDFEMLIDWRITKNGDSGIYLRGTPQVQIWDIARVNVGAQVGSGGLYNNKENPSKPLLVADNSIGEWNTFRIKMLGDKVTVFLNGYLVVDNVTIENFWDRSRPIFTAGPIELQAHGTDIKFRDIYVREICSSSERSH